MDSGLEKIDYLVAYTHGYSDAKAGRPADSRTRMKEALVKSDTSKAGASGRNTAQPSPGELADRAAHLQADREKAGKPISNADAVRFVYEEAGIPLG
jgi:hypothetical protein